MADTVTIYIDDRPLEVPPGANLVDVAKLYGTSIPVFCYHPKMEPVGMCRMCLVELGSMALDRATGQPQLGDDGKPVIRWQPKLQTACTQTTSAGMVVRTQTQRVAEARDDVLEFLLTSHPLDCPICDKGGECPLQNLTLNFGPGKSEFLIRSKIKLPKAFPLGDLIVLDAERCIQCARCIRFCDEIAGDDVLAFHERGRSLQIITISDPPFDTYFSGNTTDVCPVGALTTVDFRFGARPWEMEQVPSICPYCPVGCNLTVNNRMDSEYGGRKLIKRILPRQNESVNEIWICDKGRFGHHHSRDDARLLDPLLRQGGAFVRAEGDTAYQAIADKLRQYGSRVGFLAGPSLANEDLWALRKLARLTDPACELGVWPATMTGLEQVTQVGVGVGTRLQDMGKGDAIVVIASDLEEEAPVWFLQVKQAADRGATVVVANARPTKLDRYAQTVRYEVGGAVQALDCFATVAYRANAADRALLDGRGEGWAEYEAAFKGKRVPKEHTAAAEAVAGAKNLVIFVGGDGLSLERHAELMQAAANLLIMTGHVARPNNGLVAVWPGANTQGALDMGFSPEATARLIENPPAAWVIAEADPVAEDPRLRAVIARAEFVVVASQFLTPTAALADVVLPVTSFAEREGTFTNGMRRVQRFYLAQSPLMGPLPGWKAFEHIGARLGGDKPRISAALVMRDLAQHVLRYSGISYPALAHVEAQFPDVGGDDMYYSGGAYENTGGMGIQWETNAEKPQYNLTLRPVRAKFDRQAGLVVLPIRVLYDRDPLFVKSELMHEHIPSPYALLNPVDAAQLGVADGDCIRLSADGASTQVWVRVDETTPPGVVLLPRRLNDDPMPTAPAAGQVQRVEE